MPAKLIMTKGLPASGKALALTTPVLTPNGWISANDVRIGDLLIGRNGTSTRVVGVHPQPIGSMYRITFSDGVQIDANGEHLWQVRHSNSRVRKGGRSEASWETMTTLQLFKRGTRDDDGRRFWEIPMLLHPVIFAPVDDLPMDAYALGAFLGDGTLYDQSTTGLRNKESLSASLFTDLDILEAIGAEKITQRPGCWSGRVQIPNSLGLQGKRSHEKFIPAEYLVASPEARLALLQGLLDTDGSPTGNIEYSTTSPFLADGVRELVQSLGGTVKIGERTTWFTHLGRKKPGKVSYRVWVKLPNGMSPFRLRRKADAWVEPKKLVVRRFIDSIERIDDDASVCFTVDAEDHLFVIDSYVVTHNSTWANEFVLDQPAGEIVRLNKDTLREMLHAGRWKGDRTEKQIIAARDALIEVFLTQERTVIVDDTNLVASHEVRLRELAGKFEADFLIMDFTDVPLDVCLERDRKRSVGQVGPKVIIGMWERYIKPPKPSVEYAQRAIIVDLDGTLAHMDGKRSPYDYSKVSGDALDPVVAQLVLDAADRGDWVLVVSGRDDSSEADTRAWLNAHFIPFNELWMRKTGDKRPDREAKIDIYREHIEGRFDVRYVLDDRDSVVTMWRSLGLKTLQVEFGAF